LVDQEAQQKAEQIFDKYLPTQGSDSDEEINLDGQIVKRLRDKQVCQVYDSNTFTEAQDEIYELLLYDCFPRYLRSTAYAEFMEERDQILANILTVCGDLTIFFPFFLLLTLPKRMKMPLWRSRILSENLIDQMFLLFVT